MNTKESKNFKTSLKSNLNFKLDDEIKPASMQNSEDEDLDEEIKATYKVKKKLIELIRREAYWNRVDDKEVVNAALEAYFEGKKYEPIPSNAKRNKGGRPKKHS